MFALTAASSLVPKSVCHARLSRRRITLRGEAVAFFDVFFPKREKKQNEKRRSHLDSKKHAPAAPMMKKDWKVAFDKAVELSSIDEGDENDCGDAITMALIALGKHADAEEARSHN